MINFLFFFVFCFFFSFGDFFLQEKKEHLKIDLIKGQEQQQFFLEIQKEDKKLTKNLYTTFYDEINQLRKITRKYPTQLEILLSRKGKIVSITESQEAENKITFVFNPIHQQIQKFQNKREENLHEINYFYNQNKKLINSVYFINKIPYRNITTQQKQNFLEKKIFQNGQLLKKSIHYPIVNNQNKVFIFNSKNQLTDTIIQSWKKNRLIKASYNDLFHINYYYFKKDEIQNEIKKTNYQTNEKKIMMNLNSNQFSTDKQIEKLQNSIKNLLLKKSIDSIYKLPQHKYLVSIWHDNNKKNQKIIEYYYQDTSTFFTSEIITKKEILLQNNYLLNKEKSYIKIEPLNFYNIYPKVEITQKEEKGFLVIEEEDLFLKKKNIFSNNLLIEEKIISKKNNSFMTYRYQYQQLLKTNKSSQFLFSTDDTEIINERNFYFYNNKKKLNLLLLKNILFYLNDLANDTFNDNFSLANLLNDNFELIRNLDKIDFLFNLQYDKSLVFKQEKNKTTIILKNRNNKILNEYKLYHYNKKFKIIRIHNPRNFLIIDLINNKNIALPYQKKQKHHFKKAFQKFQIDQKN